MLPDEDGQAHTLKSLREAFYSLSSDYQRLESDLFDANDRIEKLDQTIHTFIGWSVIIILLAASLFVLAVRVGG